ncbi:MAG TPA: zinc-ribbon domain-containing protein [Polyangiaceae bacterium]|nr:zinc-ribbon domain-containing protein [Polyangiaceae bacterium]
MALVKCKDCGNEVSTSAKTCPKCGAPAPKGISVGRILLGVVGAFVALSIIGAITGRKDSSSSGSTAAAPAAEEQPSVIAITDMLSAYKANEVAGDGAYKNHLIKTTGIVDEVKKDITGDPYVIVGTGAMFEIPALQCTLAKGQESAAATLSHGQRVTVTGRVRGLMMHVQAADCRIE